MKINFISLILLNIFYLNIAHAELLDNKHRSDAVVFVTCDFIYPDGKKEPASQGTGVIISSLGHMLTAKHVIHPKNIPDGVGLVCEGRRKSRNKPPYKLQIEQTMLSMADAAIAIYGDVDFDSYISLCNAKNFIGNHDDELKMLGFPLDQDLDTWSGKITGFRGPDSTWLADAGFKAGFSGGPVFNSDGYVIGISVGGPSDNSQGYRNILPEYTFRGMIAPITDVWCGKKSDYYFDDIGALMKRVSDLEAKVDNVKGEIGHVNKVLFKDSSTTNNP